MKEIDLNGLSREELTELLQKVMVRLRQVDAEELKKNFVTKSQKLRLEESVRKFMGSTEKPH
jgi:hypothetical protein